VLEIMPAGTITGRVFDRDDGPLANVEVQALKLSYQEGEPVLNNVQTARTNDLGEYRLFWLQPGQYYVRATRDLPIYYPGTPDPRSAAAVNLKAGEVLSGVDVAIVTMPTFRVTGRVINGMTGQPVRNTNIVLIPGGGGSRDGFRSTNNFRVRNIDDQGAFEIRGVVPGFYHLIGIPVGFERNSRISARLPLEVRNADLENVSLIISPGFAVPGRLVIEGLQPISGNPELTRIRVMLRSNSVQVAGAPPASPVQADGTFTLQEAGQDDYRLMVSGLPRNAYVKAARLGGVDVLSDGLRLDRQPGGPLEILVSLNTGIAHGVVQGERQEPAANVTVVFVPDAARRNRLDLYRTTSTNAQGKFHFEGLPPGDYTVFAWEDVETGAWHNLDFIRQFEGRGKPLRIDERSASNIELRVITFRL
jgi:hypothetical protein